MKVNIIVHWDRKKVLGRKRGAIHRMAAYLERLDGWTISRALDATADVNYVFGYADTWKTELDPWAKYRQWSGPLAGYFTHQEPTGIKWRLWKQAATTVHLRIAESRKYALELAAYGPTEQATIPVERDMFCIVEGKKHSKPVVGVSGYCPISGRKGNMLVYELAHYPGAKAWTIKGAGRDWPVLTIMYRWSELPAFYQGLDVYLCPSLVEGGPLGPFEALSCGVPVVIPRDVGALDELPDVPGIYRYDAGDFDGMMWALVQCLDGRGGHDAKGLRALTVNMTAENFRADHERIFAKHFGGESCTTI